MRYALLFMLVLAAGCNHYHAPAAAHVQTIMVPQAAAPRANDEARLREMLLEDVYNSSQHKLDLKLRQDIIHLEAKINKED